MCNDAAVPCKSQCPINGKGLHQCKETYYERQGNIACEAMLKRLELFNQEKRRIRDEFMCNHFIKGFFFFYKEMIICSLFVSRKNGLERCTMGFS